MPPIYLDYNATTPIAPEVASAMRPFLDDCFGNPSSSHWYGLQARKAVSEARRQVAALLGCVPDEIVFTSGGSESNNLALKGAAFSLRDRGNHIITSAVEHPAVMEVCRYLEREGFRITWLPVDGDGLVSAGDLMDAMTPATVLVSIMHANNEVGSVQPVSELAAVAHQNGAVFHSDAAQSVGKIPVRVKEMGVDLLSIAGHKFYAPKGIGALYIKQGINLAKLIHGADHERNLRAGTENVLEIVGIGKAADIALRDLEDNMLHMKKMRDRLQDGLRAEFPDMKINGSLDKRLPNTLSVSFPLVEANTLLDEIGGEVAASAGAACHADSVDVSAVLQAMKVPVDVAMGTVRFSTGRMTGPADVEKALQAIIPAVRRLAPGGAEAMPGPADTGEVKLTRYTHGLGCACKLRPQDLEKILSGLPSSKDGNVLIGKDKSDDAAVYRLTDDLAVVQTVDFFTPIVDDPFVFGAISAANSLSDIYAMGARPIFALNIVGFPGKRLSLDTLRLILEGAQSKADEAGISIIGGHTIEDSEPKYGLAVTGTINPRDILSNSGAKPGDAIILTKPIGTGIIATAMKRGIADPAVGARAIEVMSSLNRIAAEALADFNVNACTDVTGFGLIGHLKEMTQGGGVDAVVWRDRVPVIEGTRELAAEGVVPGGTVNNHLFTGPVTDWDPSITQTERMILCDAQTSGGLLIAVPETRASKLLDILVAKGIEAAIIGRFTEKGSGRIMVIPG